MIPVGLTARAQEALNFIRAYAAEHDGVAPSMQEITEAMGARSKGTAYRVVTQLVERGWIVKLPGRARAIALTAFAPGSIRLPSDVSARLAAYCDANSEDQAAVVADAVRLHLDEIGPRVAAEDVERALA